MNPASLPAAASSSLARPAPLALRLGYAGLLPFLLGAALVWTVRPDAHPYVVTALSAYAGVIVSFLGAVHWGFGFARADAPPARFGWGVVPALVAWIAVVMPAYAGLVLHGTMLVVCYLVDRRVYPVEGAAHWLTLRFRLSAIAALCCFLGAAGS